LGSRLLIGYSMADHIRHRARPRRPQHGCRRPRQGSGRRDRPRRPGHATQYTRKDYLEFCEARQLRPSVGRTGGFAC